MLFEETALFLAGVRVGVGVRARVRARARVKVRVRARVRVRGRVRVRVGTRPAVPSRGTTRRAARCVVRRVGFVIVRGGGGRLGGRRKHPRHRHWYWYRHLT